MKNIYIFDEVVSSAENGIGTFVKTLRACFSDQTKYQISIICCNAPNKEFDIIEQDGVIKYLFPIFKAGGFVDNHTPIIRILLLHLKDSTDNVFILNHIPCNGLMLGLKENFPLSKRVFIIHDLCWTSSCFGDVEVFKKYDFNEITENADLFNREQQTFELADTVVCLSISTRNLLVDHYGVSANKICLIPNGLQTVERTKQETDCIRDELHISKDDILILFVGRLTPQKGWKPLVNAFERLLEQNKNARLVAIGTSYVNVKISSSVSSRIIYTGHISAAEVGKWYSIADIGVVPSYYEQCSYVGIEMLMYGVPIVASDGFGINNMFEDGVNASVAAIDNREEVKSYADNLLTAFTKLIDDRDYCAKLALGALKTYNDKYSFVKMQNVYTALIDNL